MLNVIVINVQVSQSIIVVQVILDDMFFESIVDGNWMVMYIFYCCYNVWVYCFILCIVCDVIVVEDLVSQVFLDVWWIVG